MLVSSPASASISDCALRFGVRAFDEATESAGDTRPAIRVGVAVCARDAPGRESGGRMVDVLRCPAGRGLAGADMMLYAKSQRRGVTCVQNVQTRLPCQTQSIQVNSANPIKPGMEAYSRAPRSTPRALHDRWHYSNPKRHTSYGILCC